MRDSIQENELSEDTTKFKPLFSANKNTQIESLEQNDLPEGILLSSQNYGILDENIRDSVSRPSENRQPENIKSAVIDNSK